MYIWSFFCLPGQSNNSSGAPGEAEKSEALDGILRTHRVVAGLCHHFLLVSGHACARSLHLEIREEYFFQVIFFLIKISQCLIYDHKKCGYLETIKDKDNIKRSFLIKIYGFWHVSFFLVDLFPRVVIVQYYNRKYVPPEMLHLKKRHTPEIMDTKWKGSINVRQNYYVPLKNYFGLKNQTNFASRHVTGMSTIWHKILISSLPPPTINLSKRFDST